MAKLKKVLLIDDDTTANFLNERIVKELHIAEEVTVLHNGRKGLDYLMAHCGNGNGCPELVILDHYMPVMDGMELMEALHSNGMLQEMRTVFLLLAVHTNETDLKKFQELGVQEHTPKPLSRERLLEALRKYWANDTVRDHTSVGDGAD